MVREIIVGIKYTHDAAVAAIEGDELLFSVELEKINNGARYTKMHDVNAIQEILYSYGINESKDLIHYVVDGWKFWCW